MRPERQTKGESTIANDISRVLIVGSWAKEHITIENMKRGRDVEVLCYMDTMNPGIVSLADGYTIGNLHETEDIADYARKKDVDLVIITTAGPLEAGAADALRSRGVPVFGPSQSAARLESDKAFARNLMRDYGMQDALPDFAVVDNAEQASAFGETLGWNVAVKPVGLTEGLGVKVFGDHLKTEDEVIDYVNHVLQHRIGGDSRLVLEERLVGEEFTLQCLVNEDVIVPAPVVQDFKRLLPGNRGPNTASMGSYSAADHRLPFLEDDDYTRAIEIIRVSLGAFKIETGKPFSGFLYGQFMITANGLKLIEYNARPGDPEWMNTMGVMASNLLDVITDVMAGQPPEVEWEHAATVCKYIVPPQYPEKLDQVLHVLIDEDEIRERGVNIYYSCGRDHLGRLNVGSERGIALLAKGDTIVEAHEKVENAIATIKGDYRHRPDIGSDELLETVAGRVRELRASGAAQ